MISFPITSVENLNGDIAQCKKTIFKSFVFQECSSQFFSSIGSYITTKTYVLCGLSTGQIVYTIQLETLCGQLRFEQPLEKNQTRTRSN